MPEESKQKSKHDASDAAGRSAVDRGPQGSPAPPPPPNQLRQSSGSSVGIGITAGRSAGPGFVTENLGKIMGAFFILLILGLLAYAFAPNSWLGL